MAGGFFLYYIVCIVIAMLTPDIPIFIGNRDVGRSDLR